MLAYTPFVKLSKPLQINQSIYTYLGTFEKDGNNNKTQIKLLFTYQFQLFIHAEDNYYQFNQNIKILPQYIVTTQYHASQPHQKVKIKNIKFYLAEKFIIVSIKNNQIDNFYQKLRRSFSHNGFNQYFRPLKRLGKGSFATVYLVQHKFTGQKLAAKVFARQSQKIQPKGRQALQNEIKTLKKLKNQHLISFWGIYETENLIYLITQYLSGGTITQYSRKNHKQLIQIIPKILKQILQALQYLKQHNYMHRDIKPENIIMRQSDKKWVLADFGLITKTNQPYIYQKCGTMGYIAPQILKGQKYNELCDIYSLGVVAYQLIVGCLPFKVEMQNMYDRKYVWQGLSKKQCQGLDSQTSNLLKGMLNENPKQRMSIEQIFKNGFLNDEQVLKKWKKYNQNRLQMQFSNVFKIRNKN